MPKRERVMALVAMVEQGRFVEAIEEFYAEDATMQENNAPPRGGALFSCMVASSA